MCDTQLGLLQRPLGSTWPSRGRCDGCSASYTEAQSTRGRPRSAPAGERSQTRTHRGLLPVMQRQATHAYSPSAPETQVSRYAPRQAWLRRRPARRSGRAAVSRLLTLQSPLHRRISLLLPASVTFGRAAHVTAQATSAQPGTAEWEALRDCATPSAPSSSSAPAYLLALQVLGLAERAAAGGGAGGWEAARESCLRACSELLRARAACAALTARNSDLAGQLEVRGAHHRGHVPICAVRGKLLTGARALIVFDDRFLVQLLVQLFVESGLCISVTPACTCRAGKLGGPGSAAHQRC